MADERPGRAIVARLPGIADDDPVPSGPETGFRGPQVCALVGISYRQLDYWARTGLLTPSISDARGSGTQRRYSYHDVVELKVIKQLIDAGVSLQRARKAVDCLRSGLGGDLASTSLVLHGTDSVLARSHGEVVDLLRGGQGVLNVVPLAGVVGALDAAICSITDAQGRRRSPGAGGRPDGPGGASQHPPGAAPEDPSGDPPEEPPGDPPDRATGAH
jgi:DNA-binding transcriptional MerR regulator